MDSIQGNVSPVGLVKLARASLVAGLCGAHSPLCRLWQLFSRILIPVALLVFVGPFIALLFYASPRWDDFARATASFPSPAGFSCVRLSSAHSMFAMAWNEYAQGSGRWFTSLLDNLAMNKLNLVRSYGWLLLLVMPSTIAALAYFFSNLLRVSRTKALLAAAIFYAAWLGSVASPGENVFWLTGAIEYQLPLCTMLVLGALLCKSRQTVLSYIALAALAIAIPGQHELAGVFLLACLLAGAITARALKLQAHQWFLCVGFVALSLAAIMLSPAMGFKLVERQTVGEYQLFPHAKRALQYGIDWAMNPAILLCALCLPFLLYRNCSSAGMSAQVRPRWLALLGLGAMFVLLGEFASAEVASGMGELPGRALGWFQFMFWLLLVCVVVIGVPELSQGKFSSASRIVISVLLAISLLGSGNFRRADKDLRGPARPWWRSNLTRLEQRGDSLVFDPLPPKPSLFLETSLSSNSGCWVNQCMALYLGANTVGLKGPSENSWTAWALRHGQPYFVKCQ